MFKVMRAIIDATVGCFFNWTYRYKSIGEFIRVYDWREARGEVWENVGDVIDKGVDFK